MTETFDRPHLYRAIWNKIVQGEPKPGVLTSKKVVQIRREYEERGGHFKTSKDSRNILLA
jgi:hypothetical protein